LRPTKCRGKGLSGRQVPAEAETFEKGFLDRGAFGQGVHGTRGPIDEEDFLDPRELPGHGLKAKPKVLRLDRHHLEHQKGQHADHGIQADLGVRKVPHGAKAHEVGRFQRPKGVLDRGLVMVVQADDLGRGKVPPGAEQKPTSELAPPRADARTVLADVDDPLPVHLPRQVAAYPTFVERGVHAFPEGLFVGIAVGLGGRRKLAPKRLECGIEGDPLLSLQLLAVGDDHGCPLAVHGLFSP